MGRLCLKVVTLTLLYTAILRKVVGRNVHVRQSRKVIWDNKLLLFFSIRKHTSMASRDRAIRSNFLKNSELKTTHNTFRDCRVHFFQQPFSKQLYIICHDTPFTYLVQNFVSLSTALSFKQESITKIECFVNFLKP